jgi:ArsR family transcriptional regulator, lead/cadmium/zinc/bismuth-responsive transcriptional repressor
MEVASPTTVRRQLIGGPYMERPGNGPIDPPAVAAAEQSVFDQDTERRARRILEALCDPTRLKIVRALTETPLAASDLARVIQRSRAATSQHLKVLRDVEAVTATRQGNVVRYRLSENVNADVLEDIGKAFTRLEFDGAVA